MCWCTPFCVHVCMCGWVSCVRVCACVCVFTECTQCCGVGVGFDGGCNCNAYNVRYFVSGEGAVASPVIVPVRVPVPLPVRVRYEAAKSTPHSAHEPCTAARCRVRVERVRARKHLTACSMRVCVWVFGTHAHAHNWFLYFIARPPPTVGDDRTGCTSMRRTERAPVHLVYNLASAAATAKNEEHYIHCMGIGRATAATWRHEI